MKQTTVLNTNKLIYMILLFLILIIIIKFNHLEFDIKKDKYVNTGYKNYLCSLDKKSYLIDVENMSCIKIDGEKYFVNNKTDIIFYEKFCKPFENK